MEIEKIHRELIKHCKEYEEKDILKNLYGKNEYQSEVKELEKKYFIYNKWKFLGQLLLNIQEVETLIEKNFNGGLILKKHYYFLNSKDDLKELENIFIQESSQPKILAEKEEVKLKKIINDGLKDEYKNSSEIINLVYNLIQTSKKLKDEELFVKMEEVEKYVKGITILNELFGKGKNYYSTLKKNHYKM